MDKYRNENTLKAALVNIDKFINKIVDAIKDEKDAQVMYIAMSKDAIELSRIEPAFNRMNAQISVITRDETRHEREYTQMLRETQDVKKRVELELKRFIEEERKKSQTGKFKPPAIVKPYGRR